MSTPEQETPKGTVLISEITLIAYERIVCKRDDTVHAHFLCLSIFCLDMLFSLFLELGAEPKSLGLLSKHSATEPNP